MPRQLTYTVRVHRADPDETGYWVDVPALPGCFTQGETIEECLERAREAIECHIEGLARIGKPIPDDDQIVEATLRITVPECEPSAAAA